MKTIFFFFSIFFIIITCSNKEFEYKYTGKKLQYSFPPTTKELDIKDIQDSTFQRMVKELKMEKIKDGSKTYYKNRFGSCFTTKQIFFIYKNKEKYFKEIREVWEKEEKKYGN